jgi:GNAT superfamily N-acetyltransferase
VKEKVQKNLGSEGSAVLRPASAADFPEMHRVRMSVRENRLANPASVQLGDYESILERNGRAWVAELGDRIVGFAVADIARSNVWALFVDPEAEGRGVGRRLHDMTMAWMFSAGAAQVWLTTGRGTRAERFYRSAGWRHCGMEPNGEARYVMTREQWLAATSPSAI